MCACFGGEPAASTMEHSLLAWPSQFLWAEKLLIRSLLLAKALTFFSPFFANAGRFAPGNPGGGVTASTLTSVVAISLAIFIFSSSCCFLIFSLQDSWIATCIRGSGLFVAAVDALLLAFPQASFSGLCSGSPFSPSSLSSPSSVHSPSSELESRGCISSSLAEPAVRRSACASRPITACRAS